jgi:hypothetical protein
VHVLQNAQVHLDLAQGEQRRIRLYARLQLPGTSLDVFDSRALMDSRLGPREDNGVHVNYCYSMAGGFGVGDEPQRPFVQSLDLEVKATDAAAVGQRSVPLGWLPFLCDGREIPLVLVVTVVPAGS